MGTDIHFHFEKNIDGEWEKIPIPRELNPDDRSYVLFGLLANVRNGKGFAGCEIYEPLVPLFADRGIPDESSLECRYGEASHYHSHTYFSLKEILAIDWNISVINSGVIDRENCEHFIKNGKPKNWCGGISGKEVLIAPDLDEFLKDPRYTHVRIKWPSYILKDTYFETFMKEVLPRYVNKWEENADETIRVTIFFDS